MSGRPSTSSSAHPAQITPTVPQAIHILANPSPLLIDSQLPSYLLPAILNLLRESTGHVSRKKRAEEDELREEGLLPPLGVDKGKRKAVEEEIEDEARRKVERIGLMVGGYVAEKLTIARPPLANHLEMIKFICKDLFLYVYSRQIDNLRTNHRGVFVLQSHTFPPLMSLSSTKGSAHDMELAKAHLVFPTALVQGALTRLGMHAVVTTESSGLPQCTFQIKTIRPNQPPSTTNTPSMTPGPGQHQQLPHKTLQSASTGLGIGMAATPSQ